MHIFNTPFSHFSKMVSPETPQSPSRSLEPPRISFSTDFLDENDFISISPNYQAEKEHQKQREKARNKDFEFLSSNSQAMLSADELFSEGKLLPFWKMDQSEKLKSISLKTENTEERKKPEDLKKDESKGNWFLDDDPSPRPPTCTVLWKELLRLKKQRPSTLSPSSSSSSSSSSSLIDLPAINEGKREGSGNREKHVKRSKKGLERTRSASIRIRPVINVPICTQTKSSALPPLFSFKKGKLVK